MSALFPLGAVTTAIFDGGVGSDVEASSDGGVGIGVSFGKDEVGVIAELVTNRLELRLELFAGATPARTQG